MSENALCTISLFNSVKFKSMEVESFISIFNQKLSVHSECGSTTLQIESCKKVSRLVQFLTQFGFLELKMH